MSLPRLVPVLLLAVAWGSFGDAARGDDAVPRDPWPVGGAAPAAGAAAARATIDAADGRRQALGMGRLASLLEDAVPVPEAGEAPQGRGRLAIAPSVAMRGLREAARQSAQADQRTVPEMMQVLSAVAFDGTPNAPERPIVLGTEGKVDRIFRGAFRPQSIDDRPYVLQPSRLKDLYKTPPAPPAPAAGPAPAPTLAERVVRGVRIDVDEGLLRRALAGGDVPVEEAVLDALDERLAAAADGDAAVRVLEAFAAERKGAVLGALAGEGGLRRVSLRALLAAAGPVPPPEATCGGLTRLLGVACAQEGDDVTLVGVVEPGAPPVPLDALILALRCTWKEGRVAGCSLDPDPSNPGGPQGSRVFGVPGDSRFAKTMLDADYAMKRIVGRAPGGEHGVTGLVDLPEAYGRLHGALGSNRFWLTPVPPAKGDVLAAPGAPAALFHARVRVRTEGMQSAAFGTEQGSGGSTPAADLCARSLSEHYDELAVNVPVFAELRTLFDAVTCAQVLRILAPRHPLLARAADLAYVKADVPRSYAGITVTHVVGGGMVTLQGGCELDPRVTEHAFLDAPHPAFGPLALGGADGALPGARPASRGAAPGLEDTLLEAGRLLGAEAYVAARGRLSDLLDAHPDDAEVLALRAVARFHAGEQAAGLLEAEEAAALDPSSPGLEATWRHLKLEAEDPQALVGLGAPVAEALEAVYVSRAAADGLAQRFDKALRQAERAVKVRPTSSAARLLRGTLLWLSGDAVAATGAAAEAAVLDPASPEPLVLAAWVALQRGDAPAAASSLDRAVALHRSAETLGTRALARVVAGDLPGGAADASAAIALDPGERAVGMAVDAFRAAAIYGPEGGRAIVRAQLMLPSAVQLAIYEGQQALAGGNAAAAIPAFERALAGMGEGRVPADRLRESLAVETVSFLLARASMGVLGSDPDAEARIRARADDVERLHPDWVSPRWIRALAAQKKGDVIGAIEGFQRCRGIDPATDALLRQSFPPERAALDGILSILEMSLLLGAPEAEGRRRMPDALVRLEAAYRATSSAPAAEGVRAFFEDAAASLDAPRPPGPRDAAPRPKGTALRDTLRGLAARLPPPGPLPPAQAMLQSFFYALLAGAEQDAGGDAAGAVRALRALAAAPDLYEPVTNVLVSSRQQILAFTLQHLLKDLGPSPEPEALPELAATDPVRARAFLERLLAPTRARAATYGDPILAWLIDETGLEAWEGTLAQGRRQRLGRIGRVLGVATDPAKVARLEAARAALEADLARDEAGAKARLGAARRALLATLATPSDVKTFEALLGARASGSGERSAELAPGPADAERLAQVGLAASLRALGIALTETRK